MHYGSVIIIATATFGYHWRAFVKLLNIDLRVGGDRRKSHPFGIQGPWLALGKMGGLIFTDRRTTVRRAEDKQRRSQSI